MRLLFVAIPAAVLAVAAPAQMATGAKVPASFSAVDTQGKSRNLSSISGRKGVVLVFIRSARWCPFCQAQLKAMKPLQGELAKRGYGLAAISYDPPADLAKFAKAQAIGFPLLADEKSVMIDAFGLRDPAYAKGSFAHGVPKASTYVIDTAGTVRWRTVAADYKVRDDNATILTAVDRLR